MVGVGPGGDPQAVKKFAETLCPYWHGIANRCEYPIHTGRLEVVNNKIRSSRGGFTASTQEKKRIKKEDIMPVAEAPPPIFKKSLLLQLAI